MSVCVCIGVYVCTYVSSEYSCRHTQEHMPMHTHTHVHKRAHIHKRCHTYTHKHTHTNAHTHTHTHSHTGENWDIRTRPPQHAHLWLVTSLSLTHTHTHTHLLKHHTFCPNINLPLTSHRPFLRDLRPTVIKSGSYQFGSSPCCVRFFFFGIMRRLVLPREYCSHRESARVINCLSASVLLRTGSHRESLSQRAIIIDHTERAHV